MQVMPEEHVGGHKCNPENWNFYERRSVKNLKRKMLALKLRARKKAEKNRRRLNGESSSTSRDSSYESIFGNPHLASQLDIDDLEMGFSDNPLRT